MTRQARSIESCIYEQLSHEIAIESCREGIEFLANASH